MRIGQKFFDVEQAFHRIGRIVNDGHAPVFDGPDGGRHCLGGEGIFHTLQIHAGGHDFADVHLVEREDLVDHIALFAPHNTGAFADAEQGPVFVRSRGAIAGFARRKIRDPLDPPNQGCGQSLEAAPDLPGPPLKPMDERGQFWSQGFRATDQHRLGRNLAAHQNQQGQHRDRQQICVVRNEPLQEIIAEHGGGNIHERIAKQNRGEQALRAVEHFTDELPRGWVILPEPADLQLAQGK